jgi:ABC-2 type transport system ATP-binding protein
MSAILVQNLEKSYPVPGKRGSFHKVIDNLSLEVKKGETVSVLGPNGAGKTSLLKLILGLRNPDKGSVELLGLPAGSSAARKKVAYICEHPTSFPFAVKSQFLNFFDSLKQVDAARAEKLRELASDFINGISEDTKMQQYSKGMVQRMNFARALLGDPEILFLDEPVLGLDPIGQLAIESMISKLKDMGKTIYINTHSVDFALRVSHRIVVMNRGSIIAGKPAKEWPVNDLNALFLELDSYRS